MSNAIKNPPAELHGSSAKPKDLVVSGPDAVALPKVVTTSDPKHDGVEIYGKVVAPRVKWTCGACRTRNDDPLPLPVAKVETKFCRKCRRRSQLHFTEKPAEKASEP